MPARYNSLREGLFPPVSRILCFPPAPWPSRGSPCPAILGRKRRRETHVAWVHYIFSFVCFLIGLLEPCVSSVVFFQNVHADIASVSSERQTVREDPGRPSGIPAVRWGQRGAGAFLGRCVAFALTPWKPLDSRLPYWRPRLPVPCHQDVIQRFGDALHNYRRLLRIPDCSLI